MPILDDTDETATLQRQHQLFSRISLCRLSGRARAQHGGSRGTNLSTTSIGGGAGVIGVRYTGEFASRVGDHQVWHRNEGLIEL